MLQKHSFMRWNCPEVWHKQYIENMDLQGNKSRQKQTEDSRAAFGGFLLSCISRISGPGFIVQSFMEKGY